MNEFIFVHSNGGWWLKLTDVDQVAYYHKNTMPTKLGNAFELYLRHGHPLDMFENTPLEDRIALYNNPDFKMLQAACIMAEKAGSSIYEGFQLLSVELGMTKFQVLKDYGAVYINRVGGHTFSLEYDNFCCMKKLVWPDFTESDIRIKKFEGGSHYYAFVGNVEVRKGDSVKWNTYKRAHEAALELIRSAKGD